MMVLKRHESAREDIGKERKGIRRQSEGEGRVRFFAEMISRTTKDQ